jgi:hypothetical protein
MKISQFIFPFFILSTPLSAEYGPPIQNTFDTAREISVKNQKGYAKAGFSGQVQVLGMHTYAGDWKSYLSPVDLAVGWGPLSQRKALDELRFTQGDRFYYWKIPEESLEKWTASQVILNSTNIHIIPANKDISNRLLTLRAGDTIYIEGYLVDVLNPEGAIWETSMYRTDVGPGACEILILTGVSFIPNQTIFDTTESQEKKR